MVENDIIKACIGLQLLLQTATQTMSKLVELKLAITQLNMVVDKSLEVCTFNIE